MAKQASCLTMNCDGEHDENIILSRKMIASRAIEMEDEGRWFGAKKDGEAGVAGRGLDILGSRWRWKLFSISGSRSELLNRARGRAKGRS